MSHLWVYLLLVVLIALEGEVAIFVAAAAASAGFLNPWAVFGIAVIGNLVSDILWYLLGYYSPIDLLLRRFKWFGVTAEKLNLLNRIISRDVIKLLLFAKLSNWMTIPSLIAVGVARVPWQRWILLVVISNTVVAVIMVPLGYFVTASFLQVQKGLGYIALGFTLLFILGIIFYARRLLSRQGLAATLEKPGTLEKPNQT